MFRRTSHCVCPPNSSFKANPLKPDQSFHITNVSSDDFLMHSPPLPPRTIKNDFSSATKKYPSNKNTFSEWNDKTNCYDKTVQCNCSRPHSCPAEESSFIRTPPIPPKTTCNAGNAQGKSKNLKVIDEQGKKIEQTKTDGRKSSRHRASEKGNNRKKSRSNSRSIARDEKSAQLSNNNNLDKMSFLPDNVEIRVNKYLTKNHDSLVEKNSQKSFGTKSNELCKICENNEHVMKFHSRAFPDAVRHDMPTGHQQQQQLQQHHLHHHHQQQHQHQQQQLQQHQHQQQPDLICDQRGNGATAIGPSSQHKLCSTKFRSKWKTKITQLWSKSKKPTDHSSPVSRDTAVTPENPHLLLHQYADEAPRPRRSKSLHLIPDSSLSPKTSMQLKSSAPTATDASITKNSSIFAVISPSTARWKRNLFCISPKTGSSGNKKSEYNVSMVSTSKANNHGNSHNANNNNNNANNNNNNNSSSGSNNNNNNSSGNNCNSNSNNISSSSNNNGNCQQRNAPPSIGCGRISPVHLMAASTHNDNHLSSEASRRDKDPMSVSSNSHSSGKIVMMVNQKLPQTRPEVT